jgi:hypothetical protein
MIYRDDSKNWKVAVGKDKIYLIKKTSKLEDFLYLGN